MATIVQMITAGKLEPFELPDWEMRTTIRPLYMTPSFFDWVENKQELQDAKLKIGGRTLYEHLLLMLCGFSCAPRIGAGDLRRVMPTAKGVLKMHPPGLRLYGWCPATDALVIVTGALESETKADKRLNDQKRREVLDFARKHQLSQTIMIGELFALFPPRTQ